MSLRGLLLYLSLALSLIGVGVWAQGGPGPVPTNITCGSGLTCSPNPITGFGSIAATGSGSVTQVNVGACLTGGPITTTGTLVGAAGVDPRTSTVEALLNTDQCELVTFNNGSPVAASIAQAGVGGNFNSFWSADLLNLGAGTVTLTPAVSTVNGSATLVLPSGQGCKLFSDGANYEAQCGLQQVNAVLIGTLTAANDCGSTCYTFVLPSTFNSVDIHLNAITGCCAGAYGLNLTFGGVSGGSYKYSGTLITSSFAGGLDGFYNNNDTAIWLGTGFAQRSSGWIHLAGLQPLSLTGHDGPQAGWIISGRDNGDGAERGYQGTAHYDDGDSGTPYATSVTITAPSRTIQGSISVWGWPNE